MTLTDKKIYDWSERHHLTKKKISPLPADIIEKIKANINNDFLPFSECDNYYRRNKCFFNSILAAQEFKGGIQTIIIEGVVINDDGRAYGHYWNCILFKGGQNADFDVTLMYVAPEQEANMSKEYFEFRNYTVEKIKAIIKPDNIFFFFLRSIIEDYYNENPELKERFNQ
jgi:hypothetical protein